MAQSYNDPAKPNIPTVANDEPIETDSLLELVLLTIPATDAICRDKTSK
jgi:hypothetical protein